MRRASRRWRRRVYPRWPRGLDGYEPAGAEFPGLPQCGCGNGAGGGQRERAVERHLQGNKIELHGRCMARRCSAAECTFTSLNAQVVVRIE